MRRMTCLVVLAVVLSLVLPPAAAEAGDILRATIWTVTPGQEQQFEEGLEKHNQFHAAQGDTWAFMTFQYISGEDEGQYFRFTPGHAWADFDSEYAHLDEAGDAADMAANVLPHVQSARTVFYEHHPDISQGAGGPMPLTRVIVFQLKPFQAEGFLASVKRVHEVLSAHEGGWPAYEWYSVADGGMGGQFAVVLPRESWAGFEEPDPSFDEVVGQGLGADAAAVFQAMGDAVDKTWSYTIEFRPDLSYMPQAGGGGDDGGGE